MVIAKSTIRLITVWLLICLIVEKASTQDKIEILFTQPILAQYQDQWSLNTATGGDIVRERIVQLINDASYTLDICVYNNNSLEITAAIINAKLRGVRVRYITDVSTSNSALGSNIPFTVLRLSPSKGIMHNKFILKDALVPNKAEMMTGSMNLTNSGIDEDANNVFLFKNYVITSIYLKEFEEMWDSSTDVPGPDPKSGSAKRDNTMHHVNIVGKDFEIYFAPSDSTQAHIQQSLATTDHSLRFAMYTFTNDEITNQLISVGQIHNDFLGIVDNIGTSRRSLSLLNAAGLNVIEHYPDPLLHHKYAIIDAGVDTSDPIVITGSFNWTFSAENYNDENTIIIHDAEIAKLFQAEFYSRFCELVPGDCSALKNRNLSSDDPIASVVIQQPTDLNEIFKKYGLNMDYYFIYNAEGRPIIFQTSEAGKLDSEYQLNNLPGGIFYLILGNKKSKKIIKLIKI